jgi:hypothetical protein
MRIASLDVRRRTGGDSLVLNGNIKSAECRRKEPAVMNIQQKAAVAVLDVLIIIELCISIYYSNQDPENMTMLFLKSFFLMLIPTLIVARVAIKRLRSKEPETKT